ncbi:hypothetical protein MACH10_04610 [Thalassospira tepidiphila]|uniref:tripartite tricarboxylate transporter TctB family protein n=1 Tax=Thalassospira tepidiphila TaxID=393657 RepID=UPI002923A42E|nr:hypothetical protein MACH10_04610 [Thalassospira tepidiphila]
MSNAPSERPAELVFAVIISVFSVVAFWQAYEISGFSSSHSAGVFPMLAAGTMLLSSFFILCKTATSSVPSHRTIEELRLFFRQVLPFRQFAILVLMAAYLFSMPWLGFIVSSGLFLLISFSYLWGKGIFATLSVTAASLASIYFIFRVVFQVVLPQGEWFRGLF